MVLRAGVFTVTKKIVSLLLTAAVMCGCAGNPSGMEREKTASELVSGYITLAESYYNDGDLEKAIETLEEGYSETADKQIKKLLEEYRQKNDTQKNDPRT